MLMMLTMSCDFNFVVVHVLYGFHQNIRFWKQLYFSSLNSATCTCMYCRIQSVKLANGTSNISHSGEDFLQDKRSSVSSLIKILGWCFSFLNCSCQFTHSSSTASACTSSDLKSRKYFPKDLDVNHPSSSVQFFKSSSFQRHIQFFSLLIPQFHCQPDIPQQALQWSTENWVWQYQCQTINRIRLPLLTDATIVIQISMHWFLSKWINPLYSLVLCLIWFHPNTAEQFGRVCAYNVHVQAPTDKPCSVTESQSGSRVFVILLHMYVNTKNTMHTRNKEVSVLRKPVHYCRIYQYKNNYLKEGNKPVTTVNGILLLEKVLVETKINIPLNITCARVLCTITFELNNQNISV